MTREEWIEVAYQELIKQTGKAANKAEELHLHQWAETMAESYFDDDPSWSPEDAVGEDLSYV